MQLSPAVRKTACSETLRFTGPFSISNSPTTGHERFSLRLSPSRSLSLGHKGWKVFFISLSLLRSGSRARSLALSVSLSLSFFVCLFGPSCSIIQPQTQTCRPCQALKNLQGVDAISAVQLEQLSRHVTANSRRFHNIRMRLRVIPGLDRSDFKWVVVRSLIHAPNKMMRPQLFEHLMSRIGKASSPAMHRPALVLHPGGLLDVLQIKARVF